MIRKCSKHGYFRGEECPQCGIKGRYVLDSEREERLGRFISGVLRHFPKEVGLKMHDEGWVDFESLCSLLESRYKWATRERLISLVESDEKQRYEIEDSRIRARYGHSVDVDLNYPDNKLPSLYYGVSQEEVDMLLENGISPIRQRYVHLSTSYGKAVEVAQIHTENPVILEIDAEKVRRDGMLIMDANEDIALMEYVPSDYVCIFDDR